MEVVTLKTHSKSLVKYEPIDTLSEGLTNWTILARVIQKTPFLTGISNGRRYEMFSVILLDASNTEIRGTFFRETAMKFFEIINVNYVYAISGANIKEVPPENNCTSHKCELLFSRGGSVRPIPDDGTIPTFQFHFLTFQELATKPVYSKVDVVGLATAIGELRIGFAKKGKKIQLQKVELMDITGQTIELILWREHAGIIGTPGLTVIALSHVEIVSFRGRIGLHTVSNTMIYVDPDLPETYELKLMDVHITPPPQRPQNVPRSSKRVMVSVLDNIFNSSHPDEIYCVVADVVGFLKTGHLVYPACPHADCNFKGMQLKEGSSDVYTCPKCKSDTTEPLWRFAFQMTIGDSTGVASVGVIGDDEFVRHLFDTEAAKIHAAIEGMKPAQLLEYLNRFRFKRIKLYLKGKSGKLWGKMRKRFVVVCMESVNYTEESRLLFSEVKKYYDQI